QTALAKELGYLGTAEGKALLDKCILRIARFIDGELRASSRTITMPTGLDFTLRRLKSNNIAFAALNALQQSPAIRPVEDYEDDDERMRDTREQMGEALRRECLRRRKVLLSPKKTNKRYRSSKWSRPDTIHAGVWLENCIVQSLPDTFVHDDDGMLCVLESAIERAAAIAQQMMLRDSVVVACKEPPAKWTGFREGCYWTPNSPVSKPFVRTHDPVVERTICKAIEDGSIQPHMDAASAQQLVPWEIDEQMLDITKRFGPYRVAKKPGSFKWRRDRYGKWVKR